MTNREKASNMTKGFLQEGLIKKSRLQELLIKAMEWKDKQLYNELFKLSLSLNTHDYMLWVCNKKKELEEQLKNKKL